MYTVYSVYSVCSIPCIQYILYTVYKLLYFSRKLLYFSRLFLSFPALKIRCMEWKLTHVPMYNHCKKSIFPSRNPSTRRPTLPALTKRPTLSALKREAYTSCFASSGKLLASKKWTRLPLVFLSISSLYIDCGWERSRNRSQTLAISTTTAMISSCPHCFKTITIIYTTIIID